MTIKAKASNQTSDAMKLLESIAGQPLTFQNFVESIRQGEGWSKKEMAAIMEVSPSYYSDFLAGKKSVSIRKAAQWAKVLGYHEPSFIEYAFLDELKRAKLNSCYTVEIKEVG